MSLFRNWFGKPDPDIEADPNPDIEADAPEPAVPEPKLPKMAHPVAFPPLPAKASSLFQSLHFLRNVVRNRLSQYFGQSAAFVQPPFTFTDDGSAFARFVTDRALKIEELIVLLLGITPHVHPDLFSDLILEFLPKGGDLPIFGGVRGGNRGLQPTGETALFVLAGTDIDRRLTAQQLFSDSHFFARERVLTIEVDNDANPEMGGRLLLSRDYTDLLLTGQTWQPRFGSSFPAKLLTTTMVWNDLVLPDATRRELEQIRYWLMFGDTLSQDANLGSKLKPGYRSLFYGPPGTGKTLTASLLGKEFGKDVYRIDLSMIVSKYIGETEKNLQAVFETAQTKDWILFFDEADGLFSKRTNVGTANDRYANQEVGYLLQRLEDYPKLIILATNYKNNLDNAFMRRFQSVIQFPVPDMAERLLLWQKMIPHSVECAPDVKLDELASRFELSGAAILNCIQLSSLRALAVGKPISKTFLIDEIRKEYQKEGKTI
ncbi:ATP-binding protein [Spirosoma areae]